MQMETKFLRLRTPVEYGSRFGDWQVCWLGGWARFQLYYLVMLVKVPYVILPTDRRIDLAFGATGVMNGVAMNTFTIDASNNITAFASLDDARAAKINNAEYFGSTQELAKLVASWPRTRPIEIWNSFAGVAPFTTLKPVKKFTNRKVAVERIWTAIQVLLANVGKPATYVAPPKGKRNKDAPKSTRRHTAPAASKEAGSKKAEVIDLMRRSQGATLESPFGCRRQFSPAWERWCPTSPFLDHESKISDQFLDAYDAGIGGGLFGNGSAGANCMAGASSTPTDWEGYQTVHRIESRRAGWAGKSPLEILLRADQAGLQGMARGNQVPERLRTAGGRYLLAPSVEDVERWLDGPEECSPITGDNMPKHDHHKAAAHHDEAAKSHRDAAEAHEKGNQADASQHSQMANDHSAQAHEASQRAHDKTKGPKKL
jgi:hypothetical protein